VRVGVFVSVSASNVPFLSIVARNKSGYFRRLLILARERTSLLIPRILIVHEMMAPQKVRAGEINEKDDSLFDSEFGSAQFRLSWLQ
jgi:hypothetical protein